MANPFITNLRVNRLRHLNNIDIPLSKTHIQHLILTGRNGSGKTSLLINLRNALLARTQDWRPNDQNTYNVHQNYLNQISNIKSSIKQTSEYRQTYNQDLNSLDTQSISIENYQKQLKEYESISSYLSGIVNQSPKEVDVEIYNGDQLNHLYVSGSFLLNYFDAKRDTVVSGANSISNNPTKRYGILSRANVDFLQYIVNLRAEQSFARDDNEHQTVQSIQNWFARFTNLLKQIYSDDNLTLIFNRRQLNFYINIPGRIPFDFNTMSDGYASILAIVTDIILRMEIRSKIYGIPNNFDVPGIVIIDEIETHLHIELQKKILPFLIGFFPNIQFIVSTHSPFVLNSVANAIVYDLEKRTGFEDLTGYSMEGIVEGYFQQDKYSNEIKLKVTEYETLINKQNKSIEEKTRFEFLKNYFNEIPKFYSNELAVKLQQLELNSLA